MKWVSTFYNYGTAIKIMMETYKYEIQMAMIQSPLIKASYKVVLCSNFK